MLDVSVCASLAGILTDNGMIQCFCNKCHGEHNVTPGTFEEHANSSIRRPTEGIMLLQYKMSLREFCYQVQITAQRTRDVFLAVSYSTCIFGQMSAYFECNAGLHMQAAGDGEPDRRSSAGLGKSPLPPAAAVTRERPRERVQVLQSHASGGREVCGYLDETPMCTCPFGLLFIYGSWAFDGVRWHCHIDCFGQLCHSFRLG